MLQLSDSQRRLLERRNIVSVDISEYGDIDAEDHEAALERFFDYLESKKANFNPRGLASWWLPQTQGFE